jgi:hypothetical protein
MRKFFLENWSDPGAAIVAPLAEEIAKLGHGLNRLRLDGNPAELSDAGIELFSTNRQPVSLHPWKLTVASYALRTLWVADAQWISGATDSWGNPLSWTSNAPTGADVTLNDGVGLYYIYVHATPSTAPTSLAIGAKIESDWQTFVALYEHHPWFRSSVRCIGRVEVADVDPPNYDYQIKAGSLVQCLHDDLGDTFPLPDAGWTSSGGARHINDTHESLEILERVTDDPEPVPMRFRYQLRNYRTAAAVGTGDLDVDADLIPYKDATDNKLKYCTPQQIYDEANIYDTFLSLLDTPDTYSGSANYLVRVNAACDALEFVTPSEAGLSLSHHDLTGLNDRDDEADHDWAWSNANNSTEVGHPYNDTYLRNYARSIGNPTGLVVDLENRVLTGPGATPAGAWQVAAGVVFQILDTGKPSDSTSAALQITGGLSVGDQCYGEHSTYKVGLLLDESLTNLEYTAAIAAKSSASTLVLCDENDYAIRAYAGTDECFRIDDDGIVQTTQLHTTALGLADSTDPFATTPVYGLYMDHSTGSLKINDGSHDVLDLEYGSFRIAGISPAADGTYANPTSITISNGLITAIS